MSRFQQTILDQVERTACAWRQNKLHEEIFNLVAAGQFRRLAEECVDNDALASHDYGSFVAQGMNWLGARDRQRVSEHRRQRDEKC